MMASSHLAPSTYHSNDLGMVTGALGGGVLRGARRPIRPGLAIALQKPGWLGFSAISPLADSSVSTG